MLSFLFAVEVYDNEGGITGYTGGWKVCVIPAGYRLHRGLGSLCDSCWLRGCRILGRCLCSPQWVSYRSNHRRLLDHLLFADFFIVSEGSPRRYHGGVSKSIESLTFVLHSTFIQSRSQQNCRVRFAWFQHHFDWFDHHRMAGLRSSTGVCHSFLWCK